MNNSKIPNWLQWHLRDGWSVFGASLLVMGYIGSIGYINANSQSANKVRDQRIQFREVETLAKATAAAAESRYSSGCLLIVARNTNNQLVNLAEGMSIVDPQTQAPLPSGTVVCDGNGNTGVILPTQNGSLVGSIAWTGNRELVEESVSQWVKNSKVNPSIEVRYDYR